MRSASTQRDGLSSRWSFFFFFFQAEDGIRDLIVTGVQTCALPILPLAEQQEQTGPNEVLGQTALWLLELSSGFAGHGPEARSARQASASSGEEGHQQSGPHSPWPGRGGSGNSSAEMRPPSSIPLGVS